MEGGQTPQRPPDAPAAGQPTPEPGSPPAASPDERPATAADLRGLRRWVIVAGVWAVAATAVALIALLDQGDSDADQRSDETARSVSSLRRDLDRRLDTLEEQMRTLPQSTDIQRLQQRVQRAEDRAESAADDAAAARRSLSELSNRVRTLEERPDSTTGGANAPDSTGGAPQP